MTNDVSAQMLLAFLLDSWNRAKDGANTFLDQLQSDQSAALGLVKSGSLSAVGKNSAHQSYAGYKPGSLTQVQVVEIYSNLIAAYKQLAAKIVDLFEDDPTDFPAGIPANFDFDAVIADPSFNAATGEAKGILPRMLEAMSSGVARLLPDITRIRLPSNIILANQPALTTW